MLIVIKTHIWTCRDCEIGKAQKWHNHTTKNQNKFKITLRKSQGYEINSPILGCSSIKIMKLTYIHTYSKDQLKYLKNQ